MILKTFYVHRALNRWNTLAVTSKHYPACVHIKLDFITEANHMKPGQTAPWEQSDQGPYCLQYRRPKNNKQTHSR